MYVLVSSQSSAQPPSRAPKLTTLAVVNVQLKETGQNCKPNIKQQDGRAKFLLEFPKSRSTLK